MKGRAMRISRISARPLVIVAVLAGLVATGCGPDTPAPTTDGANGTAQASTAPSTTAPLPASTGNATDYCTLAEKIGIESGMMVNKHYISPLKETLDQLKALVNLSLAAKDQPVTGLPPDVRSAVLVQLQYFQALKDSDFSGTTPKPAGYDAAEKTVNDYLVSACGFTFDK
jgi:hypothetical protein